MTNQTNKSAEKVLDVLNVLLRNFSVGFTNKDISEATGESPSNVHRYINTLLKKGYAERVPETDRIRVSHHLARHAIAIMRSLDHAKLKIDETINRITTPL